MVQQLGAVPEDSASVLSTTGQLITATPVPGIQCPFLALVDTRHMHGVHRHMCGQNTHAHKFNLKKIIEAPARHGGAYL